MTNKLKTMIEVKQIVKLYCKGVSLHKIQEITTISRNTIKKYLHLIRAKGFSYEEFLKLEDTQIASLLDDSKTAPKEQLLVIKDFFPYMEKELHKIGVSRWVLWEEYRTKHNEGYSYGRFCQLYSDWSKQSESCMHMEHKAGDKLFADHAGKKLQIVDRLTGEISFAEVFIAVLGASQLTFVEASKSQKTPDYIVSVENAFHYFGGVSQAIVPDNLKSAVIKANKYEPVINEMLADFSNHYDTHILPARSRKPQDKSLVEKAVSIIYSRIYAQLRNQIFYSIEELNKAILILLDKHNNMPFQNRNYSRRQLFNEIEKDALSPLPKDKYQLKTYAIAKVQKDCHLYLLEDRHFYSAPYQYIGKKVKINYTQTVVEIYFNHERIAMHKREKRPFGYTSIKKHLPSEHQFVSEWNPDKFIKWAKAYGEHVHQYILRILDNYQHPEQNYKSCIGILQLEKKYSKDRLNSACERGLYYEYYSYRVIKNILERGLDQMKNESFNHEIPFHDNVRGSNYYQ